MTNNTSYFTGIRVKVCSIKKIGIKDNRKIAIFIAIMLSGFDASSSPLFSLNAKASSLGNAVTAEQVGVDSVNHNPATLTQLNTGDGGKYDELKLLAMPFPKYEIHSTKPLPKDDPFITDFHLLVNACVNTCLLGEKDPRDTPWEPEIERLALYVPGYGEIDAEADLFEFIIVPLGGRASRPHPESRFIFSSSIYVPLAGGAYLKEEEWNIRQNSASVGAFGLTPAFAYELSPSWSIGAGVSVGIAGTKLALDYRYPSLYLGAANELYKLGCPIDTESDLDFCDSDNNPLDPNLPLFHFYFEGKDDFIWSFNTGILWEPNPWFSWGLAYKHKTPIKMEGKGGVILSKSLHEIVDGLSEDLPILKDLLISGESIPEVLTATGAISLVLPAQVDTGISLQLTPRLKINVDYHWSQTSVFNDLTVGVKSANEAAGRFILPAVLSFFSGNVDPRIPQDLTLGDAKLLRLSFKNTGNFAYGLSYLYSDRLTLRCGFENTKSPISGDVPLGVISDIRTVGLGFNYKWNDDIQFDVAYTNISMKEDVSAGESVLTSAQLQPIALFAGMNLSTSFEAHVFQATWSRRL